MYEIYKTWLTNLFKEVIEEERGTIKNEELFMMGSSADNDIKLHQENIELHNGYIEVLRELGQRAENETLL